jgi:uncharacterized Fe-S cluster-containing radical SAM superfamily protein
MEFALGQYPQQSIEEIWKGEAAQQLRKHMQHYDLKHGCEICQADMDTSSFEEVRAGHFDRLPRNADYPSMMEFLLTNTCNLECVMCKGEYSSLIRKNREKLEPLVSPYDKNFIRQLEAFIPHLHETRFSGSGEAFAIDMNYEIWEMIIRLNPNCVIMVQTNGSFLNGRIKDILNRGNFRIGVSLDSLKKDVFESIRVNANFDRITENIRYFSQYSRDKNEKFALALCVMRQNWRELPAFIQFCNEHNAVATLHKVFFPVEYALHNLPPEELTQIGSYLDSYELPGNTPLQSLNRRHYRYFVSVIKNWEQKRRVYEQEIAAVNLMSEAQLFPYLENRIFSYLKESGATAPQSETILNSSMEKIRRGFEAYGDKQGRVKALRNACIVPVKEMIASLQQVPVEKLVARVKSEIETG